MTMIRFIAITLLALATAPSALAQDKRYLLPIPIGSTSPEHMDPCGRAS